MVKDSNLTQVIIQEILDGELSFQQIAEKLEIPVSWVDSAADSLITEEFIVTEDDVPDYQEDSYLDHFHENLYEL